MKTTNLLKEEPRQILRALNIGDGMASRLDDGETPDANEFESVLKFLQCDCDYHKSCFCLMVADMRFC